MELSRWIFVPFSCPSATFPIHSLQVSLRGVRIKAWQDSKPTSIFAGHWAMAKALYLSINQNETYPQVLLLLIRLCMWKTCLTNWFSLRLEYYEWFDTVIYGTNAIKKNRINVGGFLGLRLHFLINIAFPFLFVQWKQNYISEYNRDLLICMLVETSITLLKKENCKIM